MENKEMKSITIESKCDSNDAEGSDLLVFNLLYEFFKNYTPRDKIFTKAKLELEYFDDEPTSFITTMNPEDFKRGDIKIDEKDTSYKKLFEVLNNHEFSINECNKVKFSMWLYLLYLQLYGEGINLDNDTINVINKYLTTFSIYSLNRSDIETLFHTNVRLLCEKFNNIFISTGIPFAFYSEDKKNIKLIMSNMVFLNMVLSTIKIKNSSLHDLYDDSLIQRLIGSVINSIYTEKEGFTDKSIKYILSSYDNELAVNTIKNLNKLYKLLGSSMYMIKKNNNDDYYNNYAKIGKQLSISTFYEERYIYDIIKDYFDYIFFNNKKLRLDTKDSRYIPVMICINTLSILDNTVLNDTWNIPNIILCNRMFYSHGFNITFNKVTKYSIEIQRRF